MGQLIYRLFAGLMVVIGVGMFGFMMRVSYGTTREWDMALIKLGMPLSVLLPIVGAAMAVTGWAMLSQSLVEGRGRQDSVPRRTTPGRWRRTSGGPR